MGGFSIPNNLGLVLESFNPLSTACFFCSEANSAIGSIENLGWSSFLDPFYNLAGYVSPGQKTGLVVNETNGLTQAGANAATAAATATANSDVTNALTSAGADPSQAPDFGSYFDSLATIAQYLLVGAGIIALAWLFMEVAPFIPKRS